MQFAFVYGEGVGITGNFNGRCAGGAMESLLGFLDGQGLTGISALTFWFI